LVGLARQVEEEMVWKVQLEDREECQDLIQSTEAFKRATSKEKAGRMQFAFQLKNRKEVVEQAGGAKMHRAEVGAGGGRQPEIKIQIKKFPPPVLGANTR